MTFPQGVENPVENVRYSLFYSHAFHPLFLAFHGLFGECRAIRSLWICGNFPLRPRFVFSPVFPLPFPQPAVRTPPLFRRKMPLFFPQRRGCRISYSQNFVFFPDSRALSRFSPFFRFRIRAFRTRRKKIYGEIRIVVPAFSGIPQFPPHYGCCFWIDG